MKSGAQLIDTNLTSAFNVIKASARAMPGDGGCIVLVSSAAGRIGLANHEAIAAAKAGLIGLAMSTAATYARNKVRVNCVAPGLTDTLLAAPIVSNEASLKASLAMHALSRLGQAGEVARAIHWLLQPENSWITGQVIGVDGGLAKVKSKPQI